MIPDSVSSKNNLLQPNPLPGNGSNSNPVSNSSPSEDTDSFKKTNSENSDNIFNLPTEHQIIKEKKLIQKDDPSTKPEIKTELVESKLVEEKPEEEKLPAPKLPEQQENPVKEPAPAKTILPDTKPITEVPPPIEPKDIKETKPAIKKIDDEKDLLPMNSKTLAKIQKLKASPTSSIKIKPKRSQKKGSCLKIIIVFVVLLLILAGTAISLTYFNIEIPYVSKYIVKYLKFNEPTNFKSSFRLSQEAIKDVTSFNSLVSVEIGDESVVKASESTSSIKNPVALTSGEEIVTTDAQNQTSVSYKNLNIFMVADNNNTGTSGTVYVSPTKDQDSIFDLSYNLAKDNNNFYISPITLYSENESKWQIIKDIKSDVVFSTILDMTSIKSALAKITDATWERKEEADIVDYQGKTVASAITNKYKITKTSFSNANFQNIEASVNLIEKTNEPIKISISGNIITANNTKVPVTFDFYYWNFNHKFNIDIPESANLKKLTTKEFLTSQGFYGVAQDTDPNSAANKAKKARDAQRNSDLSSIVQALDSYKENNGHYPISLKVEKTNNSVILKEALISDYLTSLPIDPLDPKYWYGYNSDGETFRLTSVIEDIGSTAIQGQRVRFQEITK